MGVLVPEAVLAKVKQADAEFSKVVRRHFNGQTALRVRIPAQSDDSDILISDALTEAIDCLTALTAEDALVERLLDRITAVYRDDYIARCAREEPDSLIGLTERLRVARAARAQAPASAATTNTEGRR